MANSYVKIILSDGSTIDEHRLIMEQHLGRKLGFNEVVHHKDSNKSNNDFDNLELMTRAEHVALHQKGIIFSEEHKEKLSISHTGKPNYSRRKLTDKQIIDIKTLYSFGYSERKLAIEFNICRESIHSIINGISYQEIAM